MSYRNMGMRAGVFNWVLTLLLLPAVAGVAWGQSPTIVRVEEDWELVVDQPDPNTDAPQVTCVISPYGNIDSLHSAFELNGQSLPDYRVGGLQLQVWSGETPLVHRKVPNESVLSQADETVAWTQTMELADGTITFEIVNGSSTTWGNFGGQGYLKTTFTTALTSLNAYNPDVSVGNSGISYAANRVRSLVLKRVRVYTSTGQVIEDTTAKVIHSQD